MRTCTSSQCNTAYHDLQHVTGTFLAMAWLLHGARLRSETFGDRLMVISLIAALFHDSGYIQEAHDREGTGAKYTANHEGRSATLLERYGLSYGLSDDDIAASVRFWPTQT